MTTLALVTAYLIAGRKRTARTAAAAIAGLRWAARIALQFALRFALANARNLLFTAGLAAVSVGLWWERPSLALIVPGTVVCGGMFAAWWRMAQTPRRED